MQQTKTNAPGDLLEVTEPLISVSSLKCQKNYLIICSEDEKLIYIKYTGQYLVPSEHYGSVSHDYTELHCKWPTQN